MSDDLDEKFKLMLHKTKRDILFVLTFFYERIEIVCVFTDIAIGIVMCRLKYTHNVLYNIKSNAKMISFF